MCNEKVSWVEWLTLEKLPARVLFVSTVCFATFHTSPLFSSTPKWNTSSHVERRVFEGALVLQLLSNQAHRHFTTRSMLQYGPCKANEYYTRALVSCRELHSSTFKKRLRTIGKWMNSTSTRLSAWHHCFPVLNSGGAARLS